MRERHALKAEIKTLKSIKIENEKRIVDVSSENEALKAKLEGLTKETAALREENKKNNRNQKEQKYLPTEQRLVAELTNGISVVCGKTIDLPDQHKKELSDLKAQIKLLKTNKIENEKKVVDVSREKEALKAKLDELTEETASLREENQQLNRNQCRNQKEQKYRELKMKQDDVGKELINLHVEIEKHVATELEAVTNLQVEIEKQKQENQILRNKTKKLYKIQTHLQLENDGQKVELEGMSKELSLLRRENDIIRSGETGCLFTEFETLQKENQRLDNLYSEYQALKIWLGFHLADYQTLVGHLFDENLSLKRENQVAVGEIISLRVDQLDSCHSEYPETPDSDEIRNVKRDQELIDELCKAMSACSLATNEE